MVGHLIHVCNIQEKSHCPVGKFHNLVFYQSGKKV
ncbi:uncharacterized protein METZ01_LOCUS250780, partial [marine metagenome]